MLLSKLLETLSYKVLQGEEMVSIEKLVYDSRKVNSGDVFVAVSGAVSDGHSYLAQVVEKGAKAVIVEKDLEELNLGTNTDVTVIQVENTREALAHMAASYFDHPAEEMKIIGITGTKGKTTTTYMIQSILENAGFKTGLIGTIETVIGEERIPSNNTTPESYVVQETFRKMADAGCQCVVMEVSSQGLMLHRVSGFTFDYGIFTNLEPDHIGPNEHKDLEEYIACKSKLFSQCRVGILNADDSNLEKILENHTCQVETFGMSEKAELRAKDLLLWRKQGSLGIQYQLTGLLNMEVSIDIPGKFSVYNSMAAIAICRHFGVSDENILRALQNIKVKGRVEIVKVSDKFTLMIDYAHNAMSLESLLTTLREYNPKRLVCMFGCGGNRSKLRRYEMGEISSKLADLTVVTSDNPRNEEPMDIIADILTGIKKADGKYVTIPDRKDAIRYCIQNGEEGDIIVLAGKGHEDYQEIKGVKYKMDERVLIEEILNEQ